jgi:parallel beta-helix repeat protein
MIKTESLLVLFIITSLLILNIPFYAIGDTQLGLPPANGDWVVSDKTEMNDTTIVINGNLTVTSSGLLNLTNVTLEMNGNITVAGQFNIRNVTIIMNNTEIGNITNGIYGIVVEPTGSMYIFDYDGKPETNDSSVITSALLDGKHRYTFWVQGGADFLMENSEIVDCGYDFLLPYTGGVYSSGLFIETDNVQIKNSTISRAKNGIILTSSNGSYIYNCTIARGTMDTFYYGDYGIAIVDDSSYNNISKCKILDFDFSIHIIYSDNNTISNCNINDSIKQLVTSRQTLGIAVHYSDYNRFINNNEYMVYYGIYFNECNWSVIRNHTINESADGIILAYGCNNLTLENINITELAYPFSMLEALGIRFYWRNANITIQNVSISSKRGAPIEAIRWDEPRDSKDFSFRNCTVESSSIALSLHGFGVPTDYTIGNVVIEDCYFTSDLHALATLHQLSNWSFTNCTFKKTSSLRDYNFWNGIISISNNVWDIDFTNCEFYPGNPLIDSNGIAITSSYDDMVFSVTLNNCSISNNRQHGIFVSKQGSQIGGSLWLNDITVEGNKKNGLLINNVNLMLDINNSNISNNDNYGIRIEKPKNSFIHITNSTILNNSHSGMSIFNADASTILDVENSTFKRNGQNGLETPISSCNINLHESDFIENQNNGLDLANCPIELKNINVNDNLGVGLNAFSCTGNITENSFSNNFLEGVIINESQGDIFITDNLIKNNGNKLGQSQMNIIDSRPIIQNNIFASNQDTPSYFGLKIFDSEQIEISENLFNGNFTSAVIDIRYSDVQIERNQILASGPQAVGIRTYDDSTADINNNTITAQGKYGILISSDQSDPIVDNVFQNWEFGINVEDAYAEIINNSIRNSLQTGIQIKENAEVYLENNMLRNNEKGITIEGLANINQNTIRSSNDVGIWVKDSGIVSLTENSIVDNNKGITISGGVVELSENLIHANEIGLFLDNVIDETFSNDIIQNNNIGLKAKDSEFYISRYSFLNNNDTIVLNNSICKIYNTSIENSERDFILDSDSHCWVVNTKMPEEDIQILDFQSGLERQWYMNLTVTSPSNTTINDLEVFITDRNGNFVFSEKTGFNGEINLINLTSIQWTYKDIEDPNPYKIILSKVRYGTTVNNINITENIDSVLIAYRLSELITNIEVEDRPNDQGGAILLNWSSIPILNFGSFNIYGDTKYIDSDTIVDLTPINLFIKNQSTNSVVITEINGQPLENGQRYYFVVTIEDNNNLEDLDNFKISNSVIPIDNLAPEPVASLTAVDTPDDNGGSITIMWNASDANDFDYYEVYSFTANFSTSLGFLNLTPALKINDISETEAEIPGLENDLEYFVAVLVFDINHNINYSIEIFGPISPYDNLPPVINEKLSTPSILDPLEFTTDNGQIFRVLFTSGEDITYEWYLDGKLQNNATDSYYYLTMAELDTGKHDLSVVVIEPSGLNDTLSWNFNLTGIPIIPKKNDGESNQLIIWIALTVMIIMLVSLLGVGMKRSFKYRETRRIIKGLPTMVNGSAIELINRKREEGDKYFLSKLLEELPGSFQTKPQKLFFLLNTLAKDDNSEIRDSAGKNIAVLLDKNPHSVFPWLRTMQIDDVRPEVYITVYQQVKNEIIKNVVKAVHSNLVAKTEEEYKKSLEIATVALQTSGGIKFGMEMSMIYSILNEFYKYRTVSKISTSKPVIDKIQTLRNWASEIFYPEAISVFGKMGLVAESLDKYEKVDSVQEKLSYLTLGLNMLEEASRLSREKLISPEREIFFMILNSWRNIISLSIRELRGRADLSLNLIGKEALIEQKKMTVMLEIQNSGRSTAERVLVELVPSDDYVVLTAPKEVGNIGFMKKKEVTLELRPKTSDAFRVEFTIHYDDAERKEKSISFGDLVTFMKVGAEFKEIPNPYIVGTPIKTGSNLFVGRRDLIDFIQQNVRGSLQENIIVLIGHRRTGKTTLLKQLPVYLEKQYIPVYIDIQGIIDPGMDAFFYLMATEIVAAMRQRGIQISTPEFEDFKERPSFYFEYKFLKEVNDLLGYSVLVLMFDEFEELEVKVDSGLLNKNIFSYLRHLMQHTEKLAFIFTGTYRLEDLKTDYWSIMFNIAIYKRISFLNETETKELIMEPVRNYNMTYDSLAIEKIFRLTHGHPYFTQLLCHALVNFHNREKKNYITIQEVNHELNKIIERGQMHFDFIWDRSSINERLVMTAITRVIQEDEPVTASSIVNKLAEYGLTIDTTEVNETLDILVGKDIISKILDHTTTYEFKVDLIRIWLERTKHIDQVVEKYRNG